MRVIDWLEKTYEVEKYKEYAVRPFAFCKDGYGISIQGGDASKYCEPREKCNEYYELELGFPTAEDELINRYAEKDDDYTQTVYSYVPIELVEDLIEKHGGIDYDKSIKFHCDKYNKANQKTDYNILMGDL